ncbi:MAG TPA: energy-coupling factor transporter transmembrane protein EcfT [Ruminococcus sp.]|nr:energy-coupling factor transporter transmembrane protein EcfT [Ruminococcus sp.]
MNGLFQANIEDRGILLDPRTKLFILLTILIFVLGGMGTLTPEWMNTLISIMPLLLLCTAKQWKKALAYGAVYAVADFFLIFYVDSIHGTGKYLLIMLCTLIVRIFPSMIMGAYLFATTTVSEFIAAMNRMHVPVQITIPMSVMFRFFPTVMEEFFSINNAMKMRDIQIGGKNADKMIEYRIVPLLVCSARIGSELSAAALTRGLSTNSNRTNICQIGFRIPDMVVFMMMLCPYLLLILNKVGVVAW